MQATLSGKGVTEAPQRGSFHPSFKQRDSKSQMQLASATAKFIDTRPGAPKAEAPLIIEEDKPEPPPRKFNPSLDSQLAEVFIQESYPEPPEVGSEDDQSGYPTEDLIGGLPDPDRWKTVAMMLNNGEKLDPKKVVKRPIVQSGGVLNPSLISPLTGEKLGNYGNWEQEEMAAALRDEEDKSAKLRAIEEEENDTADPLIKRLKKTLASRGAGGILGLQKKFKSMDTDGSGTLSMKEFRRCMKEMRMNLSEAEMLELFASFDGAGSGEITYTAFMIKITGFMNVRRRKLVNLAFDVLDKDGGGMVTVEDVTAAYNVNQHPDFLSGKRTKPEILREFLDNFDVGKGEKDGVVTREEFANYYTSISAIIQSDDYFELMIRNAWHISGGTGWSANSANLRVLVTHSDGEQEVVEIKNDLGLDPKDKKAVVARLRAQGVDVVGIPGYCDAKGAALALAKKAATINNTLTGGKVKPPPRIGAGPVASLRGQVRGAQLQEQTDDSTFPLLEKLRAQLKTRGANGFIGLQRAFRLMDDDNSRFLDMAEFKRGMKSINVLLSEKQSQELFNFFDADKSGTISYDEFISGMQGPMSERRLALVDLAFALLDEDGSGVIDPSDLVSRYDASKHPDVIAKRKTPEAALKEFLESFDVGGEVDGKVTKSEFQNYYANISASIDNEDYFELMIRNAWHISGGEGQAANSANRRVLVTRADGSQAVEEIKNDLGLKADDKAGMVARLRAQGVDAAKVELYGGMEDTKADSKTLPPSGKGRAIEMPLPGSRRPSNHSVDTQPPNLRAQPPAVARVSNTPSVACAYAANQPLATSKLSNTRPVPPSLSQPSYNARPSGMQVTPPASLMVRSVMPTPAMLIIAKLKDNLKTQGGEGFVNLQRKFKIVDDDDSRALSLNEFRKGMRELRLALSDAELRLLFEHFDTDRSDSIDFEEFVQGVRDPLSQRRANLVMQAFALLDTDGTGVVTADSIAKVYDTSKHPDVISKRKTPAMALKEFLQTFDSGAHDGLVTFEEFMNYYTNISASIDNEDYFELMIRNAWHISGGEGQAANSANRRVLVTRADGSQAVEEIKNDLGLKADDKAGMVARLRAQGIDVSTVEIFSSVDNKSEKVPTPAIIFTNVPFDDVKAAALKTTALRQFNAANFLEAKECFSALLALHYVSHGNDNPEVDKLEKSVAMCEKKQSAIDAQKRIAAR